MCISIYTSKTSFLIDAFECFSRICKLAPIPFLYIYLISSLTYCIIHTFKAFSTVQIQSIFPFSALHTLSSIHYFSLFAESKTDTYKLIFKGFVYNQYLSFVDRLSRNKNFIVLRARVSFKYKSFE